MGTKLAVRGEDSGGLLGGCQARAMIVGQLGIAGHGAEGS